MTQKPTSPDGSTAVNDLSSSVSGAAHGLTDDIKHLAGGVADFAKKAAETRLGSGIDRAAAGLGGVAKALRQTGSQLRENDADGVTKYVTRAADRVEKASDYLKSRDLGQIVGDVAIFARREPALFLGGVFALGLIGGRFLKSSTPPPLPRARRLPRAPSDDDNATLYGAHTPRPAGYSRHYGADGAPSSTGLPAAGGPRRGQRAGVAPGPTGASSMPSNTTGTSAALSGAPRTTGAAGSSAGSSGTPNAQGQGGATGLSAGTSGVPATVRTAGSGALPAPGSMPKKPSADTPTGGQSGQGGAGKHE